MKKLNLREIQMAQKKILRKFIDYCKKNNIEYYIWAGSFLGAVRHKGFIPWDDDLDLAMTRHNYNKLINILKENDNIISDNITAIGFELNNSDWPFLKIIDNNIRVHEIAECDEFIWIDIFPLDGVPNHFFKRKIYDKKINLWRKVYTLKREQIRNINYKSRNFLNFVAKKIIMKFLVYINYNKIIKKYIKICSKYSYKKTAYLCNNIWGVGVKEKFPIEMTNKTQEYFFDTLIVNGIKDYDKWLTIRYGNYMELPPEDKRETHGFEAWRVDSNDEENKE